MTVTDLDLPREGLTSFDVEPLPSDPGPETPIGPIALDAFAVGIDPLDALVVFNLSDGLVFGSYLRPEVGFTAEEVAQAMREAYRTSFQAARKLAIFAAAAAAERGRVAEPIVTIESPAQTALLRRIRAFVVACLFDASMPLGMARLCATRLCELLSPELPLTELERLTLPPPGVSSPASSQQGSRPPLSMRLSVPLRPAHASTAEVEHARKVIAYAEANLPDSHTVRLRLALRAHTSRLSLDHPETLASDAILRVETAALEMLGLDRDQLTVALAAMTKPAGSR
ncbi:MAG: hypothetical protein U0441_12010 [Polyangiaceae bacterium]